MTSKLSLQHFYCQCVDGKNECMLWGPQDLVVFILMGGVGGLLGAAFNQLNYYITKYRIQHVNTKGKRYTDLLKSWFPLLSKFEFNCLFFRMAEVLLIGMTICSVGYIAINYTGRCMRWNIKGWVVIVIEYFIWPYCYLSLELTKSWEI